MGHQVSQGHRDGWHAARSMAQRDAGTVRRIAGRIAAGMHEYSGTEFGRGFVAYAREHTCMGGVA